MDLGNRLEECQANTHYHTQDQHGAADLNRDPDALPKQLRNQTCIHVSSLHKPKASHQGGEQQLPPVQQNEQQELEGGGDHGRRKHNHTHGHQS